MPDEWEGRDDWSDLENRLWSNMAEDQDFLDDRMLQTLYDAAFFEFDMSTSDRNAIRDALYDYLDDVYGVSFDEVFDWEAWRDAYEAT